MMNPQHEIPTVPGAGPETGHDHHGGHGGHGLMMMLMCLPMLLIVGTLIATGAAGAGALVPALLCMGMMAAMMFMMPGGHDHR